MSYAPINNHCQQANPASSNHATGRGRLPRRPATPMPKSPPSPSSSFQSSLPAFANATNSAFASPPGNTGRNRPRHGTSDAAAGESRPFKPPGLTRSPACRRVVRAEVAIPSAQAAVFAHMASDVGSALPSESSPSDSCAPPAWEARQAAGGPSSMTSPQQQQQQQHSNDSASDDEVIGTPPFSPREHEFYRRWLDEPDACEVPSYREGLIHGESGLVRPSVPGGWPSSSSEDEDERLMGPAQTPPGLHDDFSFTKGPDSLSVPR